MRINRVHLYNFSSYAGENLIDLQTVQEHNVILIGGNNGAGKTSLFTAIKLALYGPQCFKYQDKNRHYFARVKELINHDAFISDDVKSFVELDLDLPVGRVQSTFTIHREWIVVDKHIEERFYVIRDGHALDHKDLDFFQNYLFTLVPPNLLDFFFFDGEEVGEFFATGTYNKYIKNAVLTLSGYDTFSLISRFCGSFIATEEDNEAYQHAATLAQQAEDALALTKGKIASLKEHIEQLKTRVSVNESEREALEQKFSRSGGISKAQKRNLEKEISRLDVRKSELSKQIRSFVENQMPLFITKDIAAKLYKQIEDERALAEYQSVLTLLSPNVISEIVSSIHEYSGKNQQLVEALSRGINEHLKPDIDLSSFRTIHDLSRDQESEIITAITQGKNIVPGKLVRICNDKERACRQYEETAKKLRDALPEIDAAAYVAKITQLSKEIEEYRETQAREEVQLEVSEGELAQQEAVRERTRKALQVLSRNQTAYVFTEKMQRVMDQMIQRVTSEKFKQVESLTIEKFNSIIRKDNFVQLFELDDDFNINLYKNQQYTIRELGAIVKHGGTDALEKRLGTAGMKKLFEALQVQNIAGLKNVLPNRDDENQVSLFESRVFDLYNRVEISQLSKGEKQVFILSLYWAIIKSSNQSVPFIIDTPFARIDTEHRERIATAFFPEVSDQVIILSTDEEVVGEYHAALKPKIAQEYLLDYDSAHSKTVLHHGYFSEVSV